MVDLRVMRIYRRTGENTAISYSVGAAIFGLVVLVAIVEPVLEQTWPFLVAIAVGYAGYLFARRYGEGSATAGRLAQRFRERD